MHVNAGIVESTLVVRTIFERHAVSPAFFFINMQYFQNWKLTLTVDVSNTADFVTYGNRKSL